MTQAYFPDAVVFSFRFNASDFAFLNESISCAVNAGEEATSFPAFLEVGATVRTADSFWHAAFFILC